MLRDGAIVNAFMNLDQLFGSLHQLKFRGRKVVTEICDGWYERELLVRQMGERQKGRFLFQKAVENAGMAIGQLCAKFEEDVLKLYVIVVVLQREIVQKVRANLQFLQSKWEKMVRQVVERKDEKDKDYTQLLTLELVELAIDISQAYIAQQNLIRSQWQTISTELLFQNKSNDLIKELLLHIGFETHIDGKTQELWKIKLSALSNQRYNPKKT